MRNEILYPAHYVALTQTECLELFSGATQTHTTGISEFMSTISKLSKVFSYVARLFSVTSSMLNNINTFYTTWNTLSDYVEKNF